MLDLLDFLATLVATLVGVSIAFVLGVDHERQKKREDDQETLRRWLTAIKKELETNKAVLEELAKIEVYRGAQELLWTNAYASAVSGGDLKLFEPDLQEKLGYIYLQFKQLDRYGQKLIDIASVPGLEKAEEEFLILMKQATETTLKFIPKAIGVIDAELMKLAKLPTGWKRRVRRASQFFGLSLGLFVVVLFTWLYTKLMDAYLTTPAGTWYEYWLAYITTGAVFFWIVSRVSPLTWKNVGGMLGWKEDDERGNVK